MTSYNRALEITRCESIENVAHEKAFVGVNAHPNERRAAAKAFGNLEGTVQCGENGMERRNSGPVGYRATSGRLA